MSRTVCQFITDGYLGCEKPILPPAGWPEGWASVETESYPRGDGMIWTRNSMGVRIVNEVIKVIDELSEYLPMTLRQIHYQLVSRNTPDYANTPSKYKKLSEWLYAARVDGLVPWESMEDRSRGFTDLSGFSGPTAYLTAYLDHMQRSYRRDLMQGQDERFEIWTEKDALASVLEGFARPYGVSVRPCRGFGSGSQFNQVAGPLHILYFGDHDPSGLWMSDRDIVRRLSEKHGVDVTLERIALNRDQVDEHGLDSDFQSPNEKDTRTVWYRENHGDQCWELDALRPDVLGELVRTAIESVTDMDSFEEERIQEIADKSIISGYVERWRKDME